MIKNILDQERERILAKIYSRGLMTEDEYKREYKGKYLDKYGCDSFLNYLSYVEFDNNSPSIFVTLNDKIIKDRKKIEKKFGIKIKLIEEASKILN